MRALLLAPLFVSALTFQAQAESKIRLACQKDAAGITSEIRKNLFGFNADYYGNNGGIANTIDSIAGAIKVGNLSSEQTALLKKLDTYLTVNSLGVLAAQGREIESSSVQANDVVVSILGKLQEKLLVEAALQHLTLQTAISVIQNKEQGVSKSELDAQIAEFTLQSEKIKAEIEVQNAAYSKAQYALGLQSVEAPEAFEKSRVLLLGALTHLEKTEPLEACVILSAHYASSTK